MRRVVLSILMQGIESKPCKSSARSPFLLHGRHAPASIPAALVLFRPNRAHLRLSRVQAHPRSPRARAVSVAAGKFFSNQWLPPWLAFPSSISFASKTRVAQQVQQHNCSRVIQRSKVLHLLREIMQNNISSLDHLIHWALAHFSPVAAVARSQQPTSCCRSQARAAFASSRIGSRSVDVRYDEFSDKFFSSFSQASHLSSPILLSPSHCYPYVTILYRVTCPIPLVYHNNPICTISYP
nr:uncharacterized protein LOC127312407 isoform X1 [Lolium perenne]